MNVENKKQFIALGALALVLGGVLWMVVFKKGPEGPAIQAGQEASTQMAAATTADTKSGMSSRISSVFQEAHVDLHELIQNIKEVEFNYREEHDGRNPTVALVGDPMLFRTYTDWGDGDEIAENLLYEANRKNLTGIIWDDDTPLAVIDGEVVGVGHEFQEPIIVKAIEQNFVVLAIAGEDLEVVRQLKEQ